MRVNAAIVASLTGAGVFAYPLDSYKEVKEVPAYGIDPKAPAYTVPDVYEPAASSHSDAPKSKQEKPVPTPKQEKPVPKPKATPTKETTEECMSKRSALGLDFSACTKGAFQGSLGGAKIPVAPKGSLVPVLAPKPVVDAEAINLSKPNTTFDPTEPKEPIETENPTVPNNILDTSKINDLTKILSSPVDTLPLGDVSNTLPLGALPVGDISSGSKDDETTDSSFELPIGKSLTQLLPTGENDAQNPSSDPLSFATSAAEQLQKSGFIPKRHLRQVRPAFNADGNADAQLSGNAAADEDSASFGLNGGFSTSATASESLAERQVSDDEDDASLTGFLLPTTKIDGDSDSLLAPLGLTGSLAGDVSGSAAASSESVKRNALLLDDDAESTSLSGSATGSAQGELSGSSTGLPSDESAAFNAKTAAAASGSLDLVGSLTGQADESAVKREAQLSLDEITALLGPLTGMPAKKMPGAAKRQLGLDSVTALLAPLTGMPAAKAGASPSKRDLELPTVDSADFLGDFKAQLDGQLTTSMSAAADADAADEDEDMEMIKRNAQLSLDSITALLGPLTGAPAKTPGAAKRQLGLDAITALLAPLTGMPAPKAGAAPAKRQLGLDAITGLLAPITGAPAPAGGAPAAKRDSQYSGPEEKAKSIPQPANIHFGTGAADEKLDIQCIKTASGKCKTTKPVEDEDEDELTAPEQDKFDPVAPHYHGSLDFVKTLLPKVKPSADDKEVKPTHEQPEILGSLTNALPVPI